MTIFLYPLLSVTAPLYAAEAFVQRNGGFDEGPKTSSVKLLSDFNWLFLIRLDNEESIFHSLVGCAFAVRSNGDHASSWLEDTPRPHRLA
jgi:hypothetical protein